VPDEFWGPPSFLLNRYQGLLPWWYSCRIVQLITWHHRSSTSTPTIRPHGVVFRQRDKFTCKIKVSVYLTKHHTFLTSALDELSGQLHDLATLSPGKESTLPMGQEAGWAPERAWTR
jgi:hypothetical protein